MAHSKTRANDGKITYPPGVKEISDKISKEEMVRRLKVSMHATSGRLMFLVQSIQWSYYCISYPKGFFFSLGLYNKTFLMLWRRNFLAIVPSVQPLTWSGLSNKYLNEIKKLQVEINYVNFKYFFNFYFSSCSMSVLLEMKILDNMKRALILGKKGCMRIH